MHFTSDLDWMAFNNNLSKVGWYFGRTETKEENELFPLFTALFDRELGVLRRSFALTNAK